MTWNLLINLYLRPFFTTVLGRSCVIQIDFWLIHLVPLTLKFAETEQILAHCEHLFAPKSELSWIKPQNPQTHIHKQCNTVPFCTNFQLHTNRIENLGMAAPPRKTFSGSWMRCSRSSATFTGPMPSSVSISSSGWSSWRVTWLSHVSNEPNNLSNNGSRSRWPSSPPTTLSARKCARWLMWYWMRRTSHLNCVQSTELMW